MRSCPPRIPRASAASSGPRASRSGPTASSARCRPRPCPPSATGSSPPTTRCARSCPRWTRLTRMDPGGEQLQTLAADVDLVAVVTPADRSSAARVERELTIAFDSGAVPLVVVTKADLATSELAASLAKRLSGVDVLEVSAATGAGIAQLRDRIRAHGTVVLIGPSGAGKSTLANALLEAELLTTGAVRSGDARGRHTTTSRQLVAIPGGRRADRHPRTARPGHARRCRGRRVLPGRHAARRRVPLCGLQPPRRAGLFGARRRRRRDARPRPARELLQARARGGRRAPAPAVAGPPRPLAHPSGPGPGRSAPRASTAPADVHPSRGHAMHGDHAVPCARHAPPA